MKQKTEQDRSASGAEQAMHQVLAAEDQARQAVRQCAREADTLLRDARAAAKRIVERADERIGLIHHRTSAALAATIAELETEQQRQASDFDSSAVDMNVVATVVAQLAERLTSGGH